VDRVVVFGCAGSGKTTLARKLSARTGLTLVERDSLGVLGSESYRAAITKLIRQPRWVLDGAPYYVEDLVYPVADTIVVLDYPKAGGDVASGAPDPRGRGSAATGGCAPAAGTGRLAGQ